MFCRFADLSFRIETLYASFERMCKDYICEAPVSADFEICSTQEAIEKERERAEKEGCSKRRDGYLECLSILRAICGKILASDVFLIHGALIEYAGQGYLFIAKSGTGKTTHIRLWQQVFGAEKVCIVNGDKPLFRRIDGRFYGYGTPWCGKEHYNCNKRVPLCGIVCLHRDTSNRIVPISAEAAFPFLLSQIMVTDSPDLARQMELAGDMLEKTPCYDLYCNMAPEAARTAFAGLVKTEE